jgi:hypothetical protein
MKQLAITGCWYMVAGMSHKQNDAVKLNRVLMWYEQLLLCTGTLRQCLEWRLLAAKSSIVRGASTSASCS